MKQSGGLLGPSGSGFLKSFTWRMDLHREFPRWRSCKFEWFIKHERVTGPVATKNPTQTSLARNEVTWCGLALISICINNRIANQAYYFRPRLLTRSFLNMSMHISAWYPYRLQHPIGPGGKGCFAGRVLNKTDKKYDGIFLKTLSSFKDVATFSFLSQLSKTLSIILWVFINNLLSDFYFEFS